MNKPPLTRAAEGLDRWGWTNAQIQALVEAGVMDEDAPIELIKGEIVPMPSEYGDHFNMRTLLWRHFTLALAKADESLIVGSEGSLFLFANTEFKPDVAIFPKSIKSHDVRGPDVLLAIEVAWSSQRRDKVIKPPIYAESGVRELWVVDLDRRESLIHRQPTPTGYAEVKPYAFDAAIAALALPAISVRIADFE